MSIAQKDIERQVGVAQPVAAAVPVKAPAPEPRLRQVVLIAQSDGLVRALQGGMALDGDVEGRFVAGSLPAVLAGDPEEWAAADFIVFELSDLEADLQAVRQLKARPGAAAQVIAVTQHPIAMEMSEQLRAAGVCEVMTVETSRPEPQEQAQEKVAATPAAAVGAEATVAAAAPVAPAQTGGQVTVLLRARGGVGATTVAVNLAVQHAAQARPGTTALIDLDIQNGAIALALDLPDSPEATRMIKGAAHPDAAFVERAMQRHSSGIDVLTAPDIFAPLTAITAPMIAALLEALKARYDHVIVDMPQAVADWISPVLERASRVIVVSDMTLPALKRSRRLIGLIGEEHMTLPVHVVVNFEKRPLIRSAAHKEAAHLIGRPLDHWIPADARAVRRATDMGIPVAIGARRSGVARAIGTLATAVFTSQAQE